jgi:tetratricopeptide (TPR) repeat protein
VYQQVRDEYRRVDKDGHRAQTFACEVSPWLLLRYLGEDRLAAVELDVLLEKWTRLKGEGNDYVKYIRGMQALDRGEDLATARRCLGDLWWRRKGLWPPICPLDTGRTFAESLAWSGEYDQAIEVAKGVLAHTEGPPNPPDGYTEQHYFVAVSRDLMAAMLAVPRETRPAKRDVSRAVALANRNVEYFPSDGRFRTTLGIAQYRAGEWDNAIATLMEAHRLDEGRRIAPRGFFLAMAYWQKGEKKEALRWFHQSGAWMDEHRPGHPESGRPRDEAAELLGLRVPNSDLSFPADPFAG